MEINRQMLLQSFREETEECLEQMEQLLLALETHPEDRELISSLFRAAHTIKGNASLLEFNDLARSLHNLEDLLDVFRSQGVVLSQELINILLQSVDAFRQMAHKAVDGEDSVLPAHEKLFARLAELAAEFKKNESITNPEASAATLYLFNKCFAERIGRVDKDARALGRRHHFADQFKYLGPKLGCRTRKPGNVAAWPRKAGNKPGPDRIGH